MRYQVDIQYKPARSWLSRDMAQGSLASQKQCQWLQELLHPATADIDIHNAGFTYMDQLLPKIGLEEDVKEIFAPGIELLHKLATQRDQIIQEILKVPQSVGNQVLLEAWSG